MTQLPIDYLMNIAPLRLQKGNTCYVTVSIGLQHCMIRVDGKLLSLYGRGGSVEEACNHLYEQIISSETFQIDGQVYKNVRVGDVIEVKKLYTSTI